MRKITFLACSLVISGLAESACLYSIPSQTAKISWTAFKTPKKVGVNGQFKKFALNSTPNKDMATTLVGATFDIDASSVSTGDAARDKKIVNNFFTSNKKLHTIKGKVLESNDKQTTVSLSISGAEKVLKLQQSTDKDKVILAGEINVFDFNMKSNLEALTLACKALHEGVTWPEVKMAIEFVPQKKCD